MTPAATTVAAAAAASPRRSPADGSPSPSMAAATQRGKSVAAADKGTKSTIRPRSAAAA